MRGRALAFLLALMLLPTALPALAQEASTPASTPASPPVPPPRNSVWTVFTTVEAVIRDNYAIVKVIADIGNRGPDPEFPFVVRVPEDGFVTGLTITRDGVTHEARIEDRDAARKEYDQHKANQMTGGLVEKRRGSSTYAFLVNVAEFESVRAVLTWERYLAADEGVVRLPLEAPVSGFGQDLGAAFDVVILDQEGVGTAWGSAGSAEHEGEGWRLRHRVGPRPTDAATGFTAAYVPDATGDAGSLVAMVRDGVGYFAHRFRAPPDARELPLDLVLVLDTSGSMGGLKMQQLQDAATQVVQRLRDEDRLHLVFFSSDARSPWPGLAGASADQRALAADEVRREIANGATNIEDGLKTGFRAFSGVDWAAEEGRMPLVVFLTDGRPTAGLQEREALRKALQAANAHEVPVFALAFGSDADWPLVQGIALDGGGQALRVPEGAGAEVDLRRFMAALTTPVLRNVTLRYDGNVTAHLRGAPILFGGSELLAVGTFPATLSRLTGTVAALAPDGPRSYRIDQPLADAERAAFLPRLWAYHEILRLQGLIDAEGAKAAWVAELKALALKHGFVTDHTSLVVTLAARQVDCVEVCFQRDTAASSPTPPSAPGAPGMSGAWTTSPSPAPPAASTPPTTPPTTAPAMDPSNTEDRRARPATPAPPPVGVGGSQPGPAGVDPESSTQQAWEQYERDMAARTPGFEGLLALAAVGAALLVLRRKG